jgi:hypothetical protein
MRSHASAITVSFVAWLIAASAVAAPSALPVHPAVDNEFDALFSKINSGVCLVLSTNPLYELEGCGTGFIVDRGRGLVVTNYHVVDNGLPVKLHFSGSQDLLTVEIAAVRRDQDLAVLRVVGPDLVTLRSRWEFSIANAGAEDGSKVMAVGFLQDGLKFSVGEVLGEEELGAVPRSGGRFDSYLDLLDQEMVVTSHLARASSGWSGGPVVNASGELVAVTTFGPPAGPTRRVPNRASVARHAEKLIASASKSPAIDWAMIEAYPVAPRTYRVFEVDDILPITIAGRDLIRAAHSAEDALGCRACKNDGEVTRSTVTNAKLNSPHTFNVFGTRHRVGRGCRVCGGSGYQINQRRISGVFAGLSRRTSGLQNRDPRFDQASDLLIDRVSKIVSRRSAEWRAVVNQASDVLHGNAYRVGREAFGLGLFTGVYLRGVGHTWFVHRETEEDLAEKTTFVLIDPTVSNLTKKTRRAQGAWGGVVTDVQAQDDGSVWVFVRRGFLVAPGRAASP